MTLSFQTGLSESTIAQLALTKIGARFNITSINENSPEANACLLWYDMTRCQVLQSFNWGFARSRAILTVHVDPPPCNVWNFRYNFPTDALIMREIQNPAKFEYWGYDHQRQIEQSDAVPYKVERSLPSQTKSILTNLACAHGVYTADVPDVTQFTPTFIEALAAALASKIAFQLTGDRAIEMAKQQEFQMIMMVASGTDANEAVDAPNRDAEWIRGR